MKSGIVVSLMVAAIALSQHAWGMSISDAKRLGDGGSVTLVQKVVTYSFADCFYVEEDARSMGIRVEKAAHGLAVGMRADVSGTVQTKTSTTKERYIAATSVVHSAPPNDQGIIRPLGMSNNTVGGTDWRVVGTGGQRGTAGTAGLNTVGLLVKIWGRFEKLDATTFSLDDGAGQYVKCTVPAGTFLNSNWQYVAATGICSIYKINNFIYLPNVLVRDIEVWLPTEVVSVPGRPTGNADPFVNSSETYSTSASTCSQGHPVEYSFDWGDGASSQWSVSTSASHSWSAAGEKSITVTGRCQTHPSVYAASTGLAVTVAPQYTGEMIWIPAGSFLMGNSGVGDDAAYGAANELPQHSVTLSGYYIGKYEVTRGEYMQFMSAGGYSAPSYWSTAGWSWKVSNSRTQPDWWAAAQDWASLVGQPPQPFTQTDNHPVVGVSYYEAEAFCNWAGGHLPTDAQWERAARWTGTHANVYSWGDSWDMQQCNNWEDTLCPRYQTVPVGSYLSGISPSGCHDMAGNVYEWCKDWYLSNYYSQSPTDDPQGPASGSFRVLRGNSWGGNYTYYYYRYRCAYRGNGGPYGAWNYAGFRMAR
jgi:formylglycine-generating enzyme required for sulfatase activity